MQVNYPRHLSLYLTLSHDVNPIAQQTARDQQQHDDCQQ
jgi:hypothetical protein